MKRINDIILTGLTIEASKAFFGFLIDSFFESKYGVLKEDCKILPDMIFDTGRYDDLNVILLKEPFDIFKKNYDEYYKMYRKHLSDEDEELLHKSRNKEAILYKLLNERMHKLVDDMRAKSATYCEYVYGSDFSLKKLAEYFGVSGIESHTDCRFWKILKNSS